MKLRVAFLSIAWVIPSLCAQQKHDVVFKSVPMQGNLEIGQAAAHSVQALADALKQIRVLDAKELAAALEKGKFHEIFEPLAKALPQIKLVDTQPLQQAIKDIAQAVKEARPIDIESFSKAVSALAHRLSDALPNVQLFKTEPLAVALQEAAKSLAQALQNTRIAVDPNKINADVTHKIDIHVTPHTQQALREASVRAAGCLGCCAAFCAPTTPCQCCCLLGTSGALLVAPMETISDCTQFSIELLKDGLRMCLPAWFQARLYQIRTDRDQSAVPGLDELSLTPAANPKAALQSTLQSLSMNHLLEKKSAPLTLNGQSPESRAEQKKTD